MSGLDEWVPGEDGIPYRRAARVVVFDPLGRAFLIRGHDIADVHHTWWFTVGGGLSGDTPRRGAARELWEETGLRIDEDRLVGPVLRRGGVFRFANETRRQDEEFFLLYASVEESAEIRGGNELTELESQVLDEFRWWTAPQIRRAESEGDTFYPLGLADMLEQWWPAWDGVIAELNDV